MLDKKRRTGSLQPLSKKEEAGLTYLTARKRKPFTIFLVEDDEEVRAALCRLLESHGLEVRDYMTAMEFRRDVKNESLANGALVLDIRLPGMSGLELQELLQEEDFALPVIMISGHADVPMAVRAMKNGAFDFLCKPVKATDLLSSLDRAYAAVHELNGEPFEDITETTERINRLTRREREVLDHVVDGLSSREIAESLGVSTKTVEAHRARINDKMRATNVAHLIRMCFAYNESDVID